MTPEKLNEIITKVEKEAYDRNKILKWLEKSIADVTVMNFVNNLKRLIKEHEQNT